MASLVEVKANTLYWVARTYGERWLEKHLPSPGLGISPDEQAGPNDIIQRARRHYQTLIKTQTPLDRALALTDLAQALIDSSHFRPARAFTQKLQDLTIRLSEPQKLFFLATAHEKTAWIDDYETGFTQAKNHLHTARFMLRAVPPTEFPKHHEALFSTTTHFLGRVHLGLTYQGISPAANLRKAEESFRKDLEYLRGLAESGQPHPANEGFQHLWLAKCFRARGEMGLAEGSLEQARTLFEQSLAENPSAILAHYHLLRGALELDKRHPVAAREAFDESLRIRRERKEEYPMGEAFALVGVAKSYMMEGNLLRAFDLLQQARTKQPAILLYALNGRFGG